MKYCNSIKNGLWNDQVMKIFTFILTGLTISVLGSFMVNSHAQSNVLMFIADPKILAVNIIDNHEPMMDLKQHKGIAYGPSPEIPHNTDYTKLRKTVYVRLMQAQTFLPKGLHFCLYEGYRSLELQEVLFDNRFTKVKKLHSDWGQDELFNETTRLVSPIINQDGSKNIPPHSTGGAIDVYLINDKGESVDMGIHPKDWMLDNDGSISIPTSHSISAEAKKNRKIMSEALLKAGFVNLSTEYWHWSYGDRYWAYHKHEPHAIYGSWKM